MPISSFSPTPMRMPSTPNPGTPPVQSVSPEASQPQEVNLHLNDIQQLLQVVEIAVQRGVFQASELSQIGAVYDKVAGFIKMVANANQPQQAPQTPQSHVNQPEPVVPMSAPFAPRGV